MILGCCGGLQFTEVCNKEMGAFWSCSVHMRSTTRQFVEALANCSNIACILEFGEWISFVSDLLTYTEATAGLAHPGVPRNQVR